MTPRIVFVLKTGGEYTVNHAVSLRNQCMKFAPSNTEYHIFTDVPRLFPALVWTVHPLTRNWPGWWSKMEMFTLVADAEHPTLFMDLDTVVVDDLWPLFNAVLDYPEELIMLRDFYRPARLGSGLMGWKGDLTRIFEHFQSVAGRMQTKYYYGGDQAYLMEALPTLGFTVRRWQDVLSREVVSYKVHCRGSGRLPPGAAICCFHGQPRPWAVVDEWVKRARETDALNVRQGSSTPAQVGLPSGFEAAG